MSNDFAPDRPLTNNESAAYFDHNYGVCALNVCRCLMTHQWLGTACANWKPLGIRSWADLATIAARGAK